MPSIRSQFAKIARDIERAAVAGEKQTTKDAKKEAVRLSSGPGYSGTPYAKKNPQPGPSPNPEVINVQSGSFKRDWRGRTAPTGDGVKSRIINANRVADWLDKGTRKMIARPIRAAIEAFAKRERTKNLLDKLRRL